MANLNDVRRYMVENSEPLALDLDAAVEREGAPWLRAQMAQDRDAVAVNEALRRGEDPYRFEQPDGLVDPARFARSVVRDGLTPATRENLDVMRALMRVAHMLDAPEDLMSRPEITAAALAAHARRQERPPLVVGPSRAEMVGILAKPA